jgi:4-aminobutyrate aminotransferase/(S)-3-amino-2-methylpropionate transaminase
MSASWKQGLGPFAVGLLRNPNAYCCRCPLGLEYPTCGIACADHLNYTYAQVSDGAMAAASVEPNQGSDGVTGPSPGFLPKVREWCNHHGCSLTLDEILTGAGRPGTFWAFETFGVRPDILVIDKGLGSGFPIGVVALHSDIMGKAAWSLARASAAIHSLQRLPSVP